MLFSTVCTTAKAALNDTPLPYLEPRCPDASSTVKVNAGKKEEVLLALNKLVPKAYPYKEYDVWKVEEARPLSSPQTAQPYYNLAKNSCGTGVAENSWFIKLHFPKLSPGVSASTGIMFIAKNSNNEWSVWYTYK